jgi:small-conductance mechanosensitive channel
MSEAVTDSHSESELGEAEATATAAVGENRRELSQRLANIRSNADLSESAKTRFAEEASREAQARHKQIVADYEAQTKETLEANERRVFSLNYPQGTITDSQKERFRSEYRNATFHCLNLSAEDLDRMLARAQRTGDRALEQAVYHTAVEQGFFSVADAYRERYPEAREAWDIYVRGRVQAESNQVLLGRALLSSANPGSSRELG